MKRIAAALLCLCLIAAFPLTALAQNTSGGDAHISAKVPDSHKITAAADGVEVFVNGTAGKEFTVERLSAPTVTFKPKSGKRISKVMLNGEDITDKITDGSYTLEPVYQDLVITVNTEDYTEPATETPEPTEPTTQPTTETPKPTKPTTQPTTEKPTGTDPTIKTQSGNPVQTGEIFNIALWIVLIISFAVIITLSRRRSKKDN